MGAGSKSVSGKWNAAYACFAVCIIGFVCIMYNWFLVIKHHDVNVRLEHISNVIRVPTDEGYCQAPVGSGAEGVLARDGLELVAVVLTIRHGDRSAIHSVPGSSKEPQHRFSCSAGDIKPVLDALPTRFRIVSADDATKILDRPFLPVLKRASDDECEIGQLTVKGFHQHMTLGAHLKKAYKAFLSKFRDNGHIYVRSTDYTRTIASVAALLTEFLPSSLWPDPISIEVNTNQAVEIMHGRGISNSNAGDGNSALSVHGTCPAALRNNARQFESWRPPGAEMEEVRRLFGADASRTGVTELADPLHAYACHGMMLPCGQGGCSTDQLASALFEHADRYYCDRFAGENGGSRATQLMFYPFLHEIYDFLQRAADTSTHPGLAVYSGHDTVIAPLLSALGVYQGSLCHWPPYASRIAFELYRGEEHLDQSLSTAPQYYVRVLYNGEALRGLRGCQESHDDLCPLGDFAKGVASMLDGAEDIESACAR